MDILHIIAVRAAPAISSGLIAVGVAQNHAEVIAIGVATAVAVIIEGIHKHAKNKGWL